MNLQNIFKNTSFDNASFTDTGKTAINNWGQNALHIIDDYESKGNR